MLRRRIRDAWIAADDHVSELRKIARHEGPQTSHFPATHESIRNSRERIQVGFPFAERQLPGARDIKPVMRLVAVLINQVVLISLEIVKNAAVQKTVGLSLLANVHIGNQEVVALAEHFLPFQLKRLIALGRPEDSEFIQSAVLRIRYQQGAQGNRLLIPQRTREQSGSQVVGVLLISNIQEVSP